MTRIRETLLVLLTAIIVLFAIQNLEPKSVSFLVWRFDIPVALIALVPLLAGIILGTAGTAIMVGRRRRAAKKAAAPPPELAPTSESAAMQEVEDAEVTGP